MDERSRLLKLHYDLILFLKYFIRSFLVQPDFDTSHGLGLLSKHHGFYLTDDFIFDGKGRRCNFALCIGQIQDQPQGINRLEGCVCHRIRANQVDAQETVLIHHLNIPELLCLCGNTVSSIGLGGWWSRRLAGTAKSIEHQGHEAYLQDQFSFKAASNMPHSTPPSTGSPSNELCSAWIFP